MAPILTVAAGVAATALAGYGLDTRYSIREDIAQIRTASRQKAYWKELVKVHGDDDWSFYHILHRSAGQNDYEEAFLFEDRSWTYAELRGEIGRLALMFQALGIQNRTVVGIFINNSPEFYFTWWALFKIGAIPAPVNTSISQEPFRHCLKISEAEYLICSYELFDVAAKSLDIDETSNLNTSNGLGDPRLPRLKSVLLYDYDTYPITSISGFLPQGVGKIIHKELPAPNAAMSLWDKEVRPKIGPTDISQYLFTSGTTGLPKAATWPCGHSLMGGSPWRWPHMFKKHRRTYLCTPLFHGGAA
jgi:acyl-CoA synthetase (AMP-forming)/AMP-acid ligase II